MISTPRVMGYGMNTREGGKKVVNERCFLKGRVRIRLCKEGMRPKRS